MESNQEAYERWKKDVDNYNNPHLRLRMIAAIINAFNPKRVTDIGCARGTLRQLLNKGIAYTGVDFIAPVENIDFPFYQCDLNTRELPQETKDSEMVICSGLLEYIENLPDFMKKIQAMIKKDGFLVASYFNMYHINRRLQKIKGEKVYFHADWRGNYSYTELKSIFKNSGLNLIKVYPMGNSFSHSMAVGDTLKDTVELSKFHLLSPLMAHQFIFVLKKV